MADLLHKLKRSQLLELLIEQSKELEQQKKAAEEARAKAARLEEKLEELSAGALDAAGLIEQAREEAEAYLAVRRAQADKEAEAIVARARKLAAAMNSRTEREDLES